MKKVKLVQAIATLMGTIIGAGILGLPYAVSKVGLLPGLGLLIILGIITLITNLMFAEVILRTRYRHQVAGYAKKYVGSFAYYAEISAMLFGNFGALTAYVIGQGEVLSALLGGDKFFYSLIFLVVGAIILFFGINLVKIFEMWLVLGFLCVVTAIIAISGFHWDVGNVQFMNLNNIFIPYGVILFAYGGAAAIVPLREILRGREDKIKTAVTVGTLLPMLIYILFSAVVVGVLGQGTTELASLGLGEKIGPYMIIFGNLFAFFAMGTSFLSIGLVTRQFFEYDLKVRKNFSWALVCLVTLAIFLLGSRDFIDTIAIVGTLTFGITAKVVFFTYWKAKKGGDRQPEFSLPRYRVLGILTIVLFSVGTVYTLVNILLN